MQELIQIINKHIEGELVPTVAARNVHEFLGVKKDFTDWMKVQISSAYFQENKDFVFFPLKGEKSGRGRASKEYYLTIDAAKHICMLSRTPKGKELREYFIQCEQRLQQITQEGSHIVRMDMPTLQRILEASIATIFNRLQTRQAELPYVPKPNYLTLAEFIDEKGLEKVPGSFKRIMSHKIRRFCEAHAFIVEVGPGKHFRQTLYFPIYAMTQWWDLVGARLYKQKIMDERNKVLPLFKTIDGDKPKAPDNPPL